MLIGSNEYIFNLRLTTKVRNDHKNVQQDLILAFTLK